MLKAVRFDTEQHRDLLDFINNFTDQKGRKNESEAIRFLMTKGLEALNAPTPQPAQLDTSKFEELLTELKEKLNQPQIIYQPDANQVVMSQPPAAKQEEIVPQLVTPPKPKAKAQKSSNNPLLANMLSNINK